MKFGSVVVGSRRCHAVSSPAGVIAPHGLRIGWVADVDNDQACRLGRDKGVSVLNSDGVGWSTRKQWPTAAQHGVEVNRDRGEADAAKRQRQKQTPYRTSPGMRPDV